MVMNQTVHSLNQIIKVKKIHWAQKENKGARLARFGMKKEQKKKSDMQEARKITCKKNIRVMQLVKLLGSQVATREAKN